MKQLLNYFSWIYNISDNQTNMLYELCDYDFDLLLELGAKMKKHHIYAIPDTRNEVQELLKLKLINKEE